MQNCPGGDTDVVVSAEVLAETKTDYTLIESVYIITEVPIALSVCAFHSSVHDLCPSHMTRARVCKGNILIHLGMFSFTVDCFTASIV